jgi:leader peptidase (prepilin peptidase)/N-methyltransferase
MYPLAAALSGLMVWAFGLDWVLVSLIPFVIFLSATTVIDLRELRIPDKLTKPAAVAAVPLLALSLLSEWDDISLVRALLGALAMGAFYFTLFFIYPAGMGFGDVKLAPIIGAQLGLFGWVPEVRGLIAAYFIVGPVAVLLLIFGRARMKTEFPFGPFMAIGAIVALVLHARGY